MDREMTAPDLYEIANKVADAVRYGEGFQWDDYFSEVIDVTDKEQVALLWHQMKRMASALNALASSIDVDLAPMLREQGSVSFGDVLIYAKSKRREFCEDVAGFENWLKTQPELAASLFNPNQVRFGQLPEAARDTFFKVEYEDGVKVVETSKEFIG